MPDDDQPSQSRSARAATLWSALRKSPERAATPTSMVRDLFGTTRRGTPDTRAAAGELGVSQRTVQRWLQQGMPRRSEAADRLAQRHGSWRDSSAGRRARLSDRREARLRNQGTSMVFVGKIRVSSYDERRRGTTVLISPERMNAMLDAALSGDDAAALAELEDAFSDSFAGSVELTQIDQLDTFR